jgi:hypothetical protein
MTSLKQLKNKHIPRYIRKTRKRRHMKLKHTQRGGTIFNLEQNNTIMIDSDFELTPQQIKQNTLTGKQTIQKVYALVELFKSRGMSTNVGSMYGCYCPPHKGHYENILTACKELDLRILFLHTANTYNASSSRHGIPAEFSVEHLCIFAKQIHNILDKNIIIFISAASTNSYTWDIESNMDTLYDITGYEFDTEDEKIKAIAYKEKEESTDALERTFLKVYKNFERSTPEKKQTKVLRKVFIRDKKDGLSATKLTECLIDIKNKLETDATPSKEIYKKCYSYIPEFYTEDMKYNYVDNALRYKDFFR